MFILSIAITLVAGVATLLTETGNADILPSKDHL